MAAPGTTERLSIAVLLALLAGVLCHEAWITGVTVDEPSHLLSADLYWQGKDVLEPRDMPPLIKIAGGWVPRVLRMPLPPAADPIWRTGHEWNISQNMVQRLNREEVRHFFFWSRLPLIVFPLLIAALLWWWGRQLFSPVTGVILAALFALEPTALGHGALFKNDLAATFGYLLFWFAAWRFWQKPCGPRLLLLTVATALAMMAKLSMLILLPIVLVMVPLRYAIQTRGWGHVARATAFLLAGLYVILMAVVQFEAVRLTRSDLYILSLNPGVPWWFRLAANVFHILPVPKPLWHGTVTLFDSNASDNHIFLFGKIVRGGDPLYFLKALAVKAPLPLLILVGAGMMAIAERAWRRKLNVGWVFVTLPPLIYIAGASMSSLQLGVRLVLPALPMGILVAGAAVERLRQGRWVWLCGLLVGAMAVRTAAVYPYEISYFNLGVGGPEAGLTYLSDSNIDWGQDLPSLARYARRNPSSRLRLFYFGNDDPWDYLTEKQLEILAPPWSDELVKGTVFHPSPGVYAISATLLPGAVFEYKYRDYFSVFRAMRPMARAGYSILIYRVNPPGVPAQSAKTTGSAISAIASAF